MNFKKLISTLYLSKSEEKKAKLSQSYSREKDKDYMRDKSALLTPNHNCLRECMHTWSNS